MYRHKKVYELRYTDVDVYDRLKISSLLSIIEESTCLSADELGFGYEAIAPKNLGFVVVNWYIEFNRAIKLGDKLEIHTWPIAPKHAVFLRDFEFFVNGEKVGVATGRWCMINTKDFKICPLTAYFGNETFEGYNTQRSTDFTHWKLPPVENSEKRYEKLLTFSDCDHYFHVNNTKYPDILLDFLGEEDFKDKFASTVQITYSKQCKRGEVMEVYAQKTEDGYLTEGRVGGEVRVQMKVGLSEI